ncbi:MAG: DUF1232 domain-containing protein [Alphaproteobacteria bacterium]|nr:DUF1232 domain-containing protein [Alphaproteobacteria bacterium]
MVAPPGAGAAILRAMTNPSQRGGGPSRRLTRWARQVKTDMLAVWLAAREPRVPWHAKALALLVAGYALSPIDLIPDFVPLLGYLDDAILLPLGILLVVRLVPPALMAELRLAAAAMAARPASRTAAIVIGCLWAGAVALGGWLGYRYLAA